VLTGADEANAIQNTILDETGENLADGSKVPAPRVLSNPTRPTMYATQYTTLAAHSTSMDRMDASLQARKMVAIPLSAITFST
jgi:hypothetical protein